MEDLKSWSWKDTLILTFSGLICHNKWLCWSFITYVPYFVFKILSNTFEFLSPELLWQIIWIHLSLFARWSWKSGEWRWWIDIFHHIARILSDMMNATLLTILIILRVFCIFWLKVVLEYLLSMVHFLSRIQFINGKVSWHVVAYFADWASCSIALGIFSALYCRLSHVLLLFGWCCLDFLTW